MPVRIIFRGLIVLKAENEDEDSGTITARLIDMPRGAGMPAHAGHVAHKHRAEIQIYTGQSDAIDFRELDANENLVLGLGGNTFVGREQSYLQYCPSIPRIAKSAGVAASMGRNDTFVSHTVTVNRGRMRVRDVVSWDASAPELGNNAHPGGKHAPAKVTFLGSGVRGYVASECVIDVPDVDAVDINSSSQGTITASGVANSSFRVPPNTVEVLITNFTTQLPSPLPWSLHYRWVFEAAGYQARALPDDEVNILRDIGQRFGKDAFDLDVGMFLQTVGAETHGLPCPYFDPDNALVSLDPIAYPTAPALIGADPWDRPLCPLGDDTTTGGT